MINALIVDDRDIIRDILKLVFSGSENITIKDEAEDGLEAVDLITKNDYDVILMDINMPNMGGVEATKHIKKIKSHIKILAHSFHATPLFIQKILSAGASGFIKKGGTLESYTEAIEMVNNGAIFLPEEGGFNKISDRLFPYISNPYSDASNVTEKGMIGS